MNQLTLKTQIFRISGFSALELIGIEKTILTKKWKCAFKCVQSFIIKHAVVQISYRGGGIFAPSPSSTPSQIRVKNKPYHI